MTQSDVAAELNVALRTVQTWEGGEKSPERKNIKKLGELFGVDHTLFQSKAEQVAWGNYQLAIMLGKVDHDQAARDAINLNALPQWQSPEIEPGEAEQTDNDLLEEGDAPNV